MRVGIELQLCVWMLALAATKRASLTPTSSVSSFLLTSSCVMMSGWASRQSTSNNQNSIHHFQFFTKVRAKKKKRKNWIAKNATMYVMWEQCS